MANFYELIFILHLIALIGITLLKFYNVMSKGKVYDLKISFILFAGMLFSWFIGLSVVLTHYYLIYSILFKVSNLLFMLNIIFLIIEILFNASNLFEGEIKAYQPKRA